MARNMLKVGSSVVFSTAAFVRLLPRDHPRIVSLVALLGAVRRTLAFLLLPCGFLYQAVVFTPLPFYRPAVLLTALRELRPLEMNALWRAWQRRGWVTAFKPPSAPPPREKTEPPPAEQQVARQPQPYKRPQIAAALESKCRRPFVLSR